MPGGNKNANNAKKVEEKEVETRADRKICPLMTTWHGSSRVKVFCGSDCAWWDWIRGRCAIQSVAMIAPTAMQTEETLRENTQKLGRILMQMDSTIRDGSERVASLARRLNDVVDMIVAIQDELRPEAPEAKSEVDDE